MDASLPGNCVRPLRAAEFAQLATKGILWHIRPFRVRVWEEDTGFSAAKGVVQLFHTFRGKSEVSSREFSIFAEKHFVGAVDRGGRTVRMNCETEKRNAMRKTCHICLSSHDEVMFRSEADLIRGFNSLAVAVLETDSRLLSEGFMSTHFHGLIQTDNSSEVMHRTRYAYARYFNSKYRRSGRLGEKQFFSLIIEGFHHTLAALNYVNRQGIHHGLSQTPFGYRHCSARTFFRRELGVPETASLMAADQRYKYLPKGVSLPDKYRMDMNGLLLRENILDTSQVEAMYVSPRNFLYQMNKVGDEMSVREQQEENSSTQIITLGVIEPGFSSEEISQFLRNEKGRFNPAFISDIDLCQLIDGTYLPKYHRSSTLYDLSVAQRARLCDRLWKELWPLTKKRTTETQLKRCLAL